MDIYHVELSESLKKRIKKNKLPLNVLEKRSLWAQYVRLNGLREVRKIKGYHDEPLQGNKFGRRSIRLNKAWRAEYIIMKDKIEFVLVKEVHYHD